MNILMHIVLLNNETMVSALDVTCQIRNVPNALEHVFNVPFAK